jgi:hypothetical protein
MLANLSDYEAGYIAISPYAAPGSGFSTQWMASSIWMYFYSQQKWVQLPYQVALVSQPNFGTQVSIGPSNGSPWLLAGLLGNAGYVYVEAEYYWWTGLSGTAGQWVGGTVVPTIEYTDVEDRFSRSLGPGCYLG